MAKRADTRQIAFRRYIYMKDHCVLGIIEPAGIKAILLLGVGEDSKLGLVHMCWGGIYRRNSFGIHG
jgi:hypothetical protein